MDRKKTVLNIKQKKKGFRNPIMWFGGWMREKKEVTPSPFEPYKATLSLFPITISSSLSLAQSWLEISMKEQNYGPKDKAFIQWSKAFKYWVFFKKYLEKKKSRRVEILGA